MASSIDDAAETSVVNFSSRRSRAVGNVVLKEYRLAAQSADLVAGFTWSDEFNLSSGRCLQSASCWFGRQPPPSIEVSFARHRGHSGTGRPGPVPEQLP